MLESSGARLVGYGLLATLAVFMTCVAAVVLLWARKQADLRVADLKEAAAAEQLRAVERQKDREQLAALTRAVEDLASGQRASTALDQRVAHALEERVPKAIERNTEELMKSSLTSAETKRVLENVVVQAVRRVSSGTTPAVRRPMDRREPEER